MSFDRTANTSEPAASARQPVELPKLPEPLPLFELADTPAAVPGPAPGPIAGRFGFCAQHGDTPAERLCGRCRAAMCSTCEFTFGTLHVCPDCVANPILPVSSRRRFLAKCAIALSAFATVIFALVMTRTWELRESSAGVVFSAFILLPALVGTALGFSAMDKRLGNDALLWTALIWNLTLLGLLVLLCIIGTAKG